MPSVADFLREQGIVDMSGGSAYLEGIDTDDDGDVFMVLNILKVHLKIEAAVLRVFLMDFAVHILWPRF